MVQKPTEETYLANLPHCRVDPPAAVLQELGEQSPPPTPFHWEAAQRHSEFLQHTWDETIPIYQSLPNNVMLEQTVSGVYLTTIHRYENRRVSRFLAQTKRDAIRRFRFELENLLDY